VHEQGEGKQSRSTWISCTVPKDTGRNMFLVKSRTGLLPILTLYPQHDRNISNSFYKELSVAMRSRFCLKCWSVSNFFINFDIIRLIKKSDI
jgi:hypothetical protein